MDKDVTCTQPSVPLPSSRSCTPVPPSLTDAGAGQGTAEDIDVSGGKARKWVWKVSGFKIRSGCVQHESHSKTSCIDCMRLPIMSTVLHICQHSRVSLGFGV